MTVSHLPGHRFGAHAGWRRLRASASNRARRRPRVGVRCSGGYRVARPLARRLRDRADAYSLWGAGGARRHAAAIDRPAAAGYRRRGGAGPLQEGRPALRAGLLPAGASELERAEQLAPTYKLAYNIALVQMRLGDAASALRSLRRYLDAGGAEVPAARRSEVEAYLVDLAGHVAGMT